MTVDDLDKRRSAARKTALGLLVVAVLVYGTYITLTLVGSG